MNLRLAATTAAVAGALLALAPAAGAATTCATGTSSYSSAVSGTSGLAGYWRLDDSGLPTACSATGVNPGSYQGGVTLGRQGAIAGDADAAAAFDGSTGDVSVPDAASLDLGDSFSVEAWVKRSTLGGSANQVVASKQNNAWVLMFNPSNQLVLRQSAVADVAVSNATVADTSAWHYVAVTKNGAAVHLYIDGRDVTGSVSNRTMADNTLPLVIGQSTGTAYFAGAIDEVAVYRGALSAAQVSSHWSAGAGTQAPPPPSSDPVVAAAGDIACDPADPSYAGGSGTAGACRQVAVSNLLTTNL
ncbi:MAG: hypothetical protein QOE38_1025, partial [Thermoleophilaceae bacterium]|nr:hypothetical protein [Thermoleophilaceae bacterium]